MTKHGGRITSACGTRTNRFLFKDVFLSTYPTAYQVERAVFEKILLDHAGESGCRVFEGLQVTDINFDADGVTVRAGDDEYRARHLIDCSSCQAAFAATRLSSPKSYGAPDSQGFAQPPSAVAT